MTTATARRLARRTHTQTPFEAEIEVEGCPECCGEYVVTDGQSAMRTDSAWWNGECRDCGYGD